ncbi:MAG: diguanylate cyclase, partial [Candidatus Omnitrophica bacterium]|nr:diguanylate cyclase [Candidatus Omnitrophota bacterium]
MKKIKFKHKNIAKKGINSLLQEIAALKQTRSAAYALKQQIEFILGATKTGLDIIDSSYKIRYIDSAWKKIYGNPNGKKCYEYFMDKKDPCPECGVRKALETKSVVITEETLFKENNRPIQVTTIPFQDKNGEWLVAEVNVDISKRKRIEEALHKSEIQRKALLDNVPDLIWFKDKEGKYVSANNAFTQRCGLKLEELIGKTDLELCWPRYLTERYMSDDREVAKTGKAKHLEEPLFDKNGSQIIIEVVKTPIFNGKGDVVGVIGIGHDITLRKQEEEELQKYRDQLEELVKERTVKLEKEISEHKQAESEKVNLNKELIKTNKRLSQLSLIDLHTGLYNHRYLNDIIEAEFHRAKRYSYPLSVIMLDLDYFKSINDVYGHQFGDLVLKQFAGQLRKIVRRYDTLVRYGGEEFIIVSPSVDRQSAISFAQRMLEAINLFDFGNKSHGVRLKLSIAVASFPEDEIARGMDLVELTDRILNQAKESGGNKVYSAIDIKNHKSVIPIQESNDVLFLKSKIGKLTKRANQGLMESIFAFAKTIEVKDRYTGEHVERTVHYATEIAQAMELSEHEIEHIQQASVLHDLGKIGISEKILYKKSKLTRREFEEIKRHPQIGVDIIRPVHFLHSIIPFVLHHHEKWNGTGYPYGLKGDAIPLGARIVSVADVYQALISDRPYRKAYSLKDALKILQQESGVLLDPYIV